ncbi:iron-containing alcohol dehydrogenase [Nocardia sp. SYP-A9097]|uniref:2-deoxy-scyllo-inosose synthase n=1 Tax=Nocardia sp. SYP-A9097 TaxID=2663237 RepID=UPI00129B8758|nr:2-deoxy-scyllo-inosose synthase [Nocardia sp. SYP-A9097]MRH89163.1 iron-containing alcohol dehydrogenase [Nocardia sp. SYP-A9097]
MGITSRTIRIGEQSYRYSFGEDCLAEIADGISELQADTLIFVTDDTVLGLYRTVIERLSGNTPAIVLSHHAGESMKTLSCLTEHLESALRAGATRRSVVVALGGGVPGNLAGLMANLLFRGVRLVHVPTTTIAAMDSVLSLKQAINSPVGKNHLGTYYAPTAVYADVRLFATLPADELRSGYCEMAKNCLAIRPAAAERLRAIIDAGELATPAALTWLLDASIDAKTAVTREDTFERRSGLVLEYGHTAGHAIEICDHRARGAAGISHGAAIAVGMLVAAHISHARGWLSDDEVSAHYEIITGLGVEPCLPQAVSAADVLEVMDDDNKKGYLDSRPDSLPFVLLRGLGRPAMTDDLPLVHVSRPEIREALEVITKTFPGEPLTPPSSRHAFGRDPHLEWLS